MAVANDRIQGLGSRLRAVRLERGVSLRQIANALGASTDTVGGWENGIVPMLSSAYRLADFYGLTIDELVGREIPPDRLVRLLDEALAKATGGLSREQVALIRGAGHERANGSARSLIHSGPPPVPEGSQRDPRDGRPVGEAMASSVSSKSKASSVQSVQSGSISSASSESAEGPASGSGSHPGSSVVVRVVPPWGKACKHGREVLGPKRPTGRPRKVREDPNRTVKGFPSGLLDGLGG